MQDKNLLILSHNYNDFIKDQTEVIAPNFHQVSVCVRYNIAAKILSHLPVSTYKNFQINRHLDLTQVPGNIFVYPAEIFYLPLEFQRRNLGNIHYKKVRSIIHEKKIEFDLIHAHFTWSAGYVGAKIKESSGIPVVITAHGYDIYSLPFKDPMWKKNIEYVLNTVDTIITVSQRNLECIRKLDVGTPVHVIPNGFRRNLFYPRNTVECRETLGLPQDRKLLLTVGNLEPVKGHTWLIEAVKEIVREREDILCIIIGAGKEKRSLEKQIRSLGLENYIRLTGGKPHDEIPLWINACDLFVLPSLNEGNPTVMFKALGCGKPFVGTRVGGVPEVITSDTYGFLVNPADSEDLSENILIALDKEWDNEAISRYAQRFTWENIAKEILDVYGKVLDT